MIGIPYFAYMISVIAELINNVITWAKSRITGISITGLYITGGTIFMIVIPAKIFVVVEGRIIKMSKKIFFFKKFLGWQLLDATYFILISLTTIGFGDLTPRF